MLEATLEGERAGREREREEFKARASLGTHASGNSLFRIWGWNRTDRRRLDRAPSRRRSRRLEPWPRRPRPRRRRGPARAWTERTASNSPTRRRTSNPASGDTYRRILAEQRGERKVVRLEAELAKLRAHNEALRRQMRAVQEASFEDVAVIPPSDPAEADAMRRAEEEAHRLGADAPPPTPPRSSRRSTLCESRHLRHRDRTRTTTTAATARTSSRARSPRAADAEKGRVASRAAAAVQQRKIARLRGETRAWRAALEDERAASRDAGRAWRKIKSDLETAGTRRSRPAPRAGAPPAASESGGRGGGAPGEGGHRAARRDAADAFAARDAATGASAGALREARDEAVFPPPGSRTGNGSSGATGSRAG